MTNFTGGGIAVGTPGSEFGTYTFDPQGNVWQSNLPINTTGTLTANAITSINDINTYGDVNAVANIHAGYTIFAPRLEITDGVIINGTAQVDGYTTINDGLSVIGNITSTGSITASSLDITGGIDFNEGNLTVNHLTSNTVSVGVFTISGDNISSVNGTMVIDPSPPGVGGNVILAAQTSTVLGNLNVGGNVTAATYSGNGSQLTGMYSNQNVQTYLPSYSGTLSPSSITAPIGNIVALTTTSIIANTVNAASLVTTTTLATSSIQQIGSGLNFLNSSGTAISSIDSTGTYQGPVTNSAVVTAIGYTPYDSSNPAGYITQAQVGLVGLGWGGTTWHNVTGSRATGTQYTNSRAYPIAVSATGLAANSGPSILGYVDGILISDFNWQFNGAGAHSGAFMIVPAGSTYELDFNGSGIQNWVELY